ncbi:MAG: sigma-E processing peptidase SpoIIGA [Coprococcus sp.]
MIPYHSIGKEHGILQGTEVDELIIWREDEPYVQKKAVIALYEGKLREWKLSDDTAYRSAIRTGENEQEEMINDFEGIFTRTYETLPGQKGCRRIKWTSGNPLYRRKRDSAATAGERGRK